ncbi:MAG: hypothetical protein RH946_00685 [Rhodospirillales bacterium]
MRPFKASLMAVFAVIAMTALSGCGAIPGNTQVNAGITHATVEVCETEGTIYLCEAEIIDGKDKQAVSLDIQHPAGWKVSYAASGVQAVDAIKVRGAVEQSISSDLKDASPVIVSKITDAIVKALSP